MTWLYMILMQREKSYESLWENVCVVDFKEEEENKSRGESLIEDSNINNKKGSPKIKKLIFVSDKNEEDGSITETEVKPTVLYTGSVWLAILYRDYCCFLT